MLSKKILDLSEVPEEVWLQERRKGITSSDVAAICGINPWKCGLEIFREKKGLIQTQPDNEFMKHGKGLEPYIFDCFVEKHKDELTFHGNPNALYQHPTIPYHMSTPDRLIGHNKYGPGLVELKTASEYSLDEWEDNPPDYYILQVQHQMFVTGLDYAYVAALIGGNKFRTYFIPRDESIIGQMNALLDHFWNDHFIKDIEPEVEGDQATTDFINGLYPESEGDKSIELPQCVEDAEQYLFWKEKRMEAKKMEDFFANKIKFIMGSHEKAFLPTGAIISWKTIHKKAYKVNETSYRMFDVKIPKAKKVM